MTGWEVVGPEAWPKQRCSVLLIVMKRLRASEPGTMVSILIPPGVKPARWQTAIHNYASRRFIHVRTSHAPGAPDVVVVKARNILPVEILRKRKDWPE